MNIEQRQLSITQEKLKDAMSLIILLENDMNMLQAEEMYTRVLHMIHRSVRSALEALEKGEKNQSDIL